MHNKCSGFQVYRRATIVPEPEFCVQFRESDNEVYPFTGRVIPQVLEPVSSIVCMDLFVSKLGDFSYWNKYRFIPAVSGSSLYAL